ncbi:hypothetical protein LG293_17165 (plasmid) [Citricoccus nitrophenolicus]
MLWTTILGFLTAGAALAALALLGVTAMTLMLDDSLDGDQPQVDRLSRSLSRMSRILLVLLVAAVAILIVGDWPSDGVGWLVAVGAVLTGLFGSTAVLARLVPVRTHPSPGGQN